MIEFCLVFLGMTVIDIIFGVYIRKVADGSAYIAGTLAGISLLLHGFIVIAYVENKQNLIPAALGSFVGTVLAIHLDKKLGKKHEK